MAYFVRKIGISRWPDGQGFKFTTKEDLPADTIINEFKTTNNTLSIWHAENLDKAYELGVSFVSRMDCEQKFIRLIAIPFEELDTNFDLRHSPQDGDTAIKSFNQYHYDICKLTYGKLGKLGEIIARETSIQSNPCIIKIKVKEAINSIKLLLDKGEADSDLLGKYVKKELGISV